MSHCSLLKAIHPELPTGVTPFLLFRGLCLWCLWLVSLSWLGLHDIYSPTSPAAPSLSLLIPRGSPIRCKPVQVYHHQSQSWVPLAPVYHNTYPGNYLLGLELGQFPLRAGWVIEPHSVTRVVAHTVGQSVIMSFHLVTGHLQVLAGITVDVV
jgi:hypothetical protein